MLGIGHPSAVIPLILCVPPSKCATDRAHQSLHWGGMDTFDFLTYWISHIGYVFPLPGSPASSNTRRVVFCVLVKIIYRFEGRGQNLTGACLFMRANASCDNSFSISVRDFLGVGNVIRDIDRVALENERLSLAGILSYHSVNLQLDFSSARAERYMYLLIFSLSWLQVSGDMFFCLFHPKIVAG